jgi:hypothetical protein
VQAAPAPALPVREAVDGGDRRKGQVLDPVEEDLASPRVLPAVQRRQPDQLADIGPGDECFLSRAGDDQAPKVRLALRLREAGFEHLQDGGVQRVQFLGAIHRQRADPLARLDPDRLRRHFVSPYS